VNLRWRWLVAASCFTAAAVVFTSQVWVDYAYAGHRLSWTRAFLVALVGWQIWTLLAPVVLLLAARVPLSRRRLAIPLAVHVPAGIVLSMVKVAIEAAIVQALVGQARVPFSLLNLYLSLLTYWAIIAAVHYADEQRLARERELRAAHLQTELARAQVEALKMQIHPHFLFNTLNAISGLMREDVESADTMLTQLSELLRGTLRTQDVQEVPLVEELHLLESYLAIQQTRFGDRLKIDIDVAHECGQSLVPALILQPIVENAIRHGFGVTSGPGRIAICASAVNGRLRIDVIDEGPGPPQPLREGYGLRNTRSRLRALYDESATLSVVPREPRGTLARLEVPQRSMVGS